MLIRSFVCHVNGELHIVNSVFLCKYSDDGYIVQIEYSCLVKSVLLSYILEL